MEKLILVKLKKPVETRWKDIRGYKGQEVYVSIILEC